LNANGKVLHYTVTTGKLPLKNDAGETEAEIFFMAYTLDGAGDSGHRPLMFSFNGVIVVASIFNFRRRGPAREDATGGMTPGFPQLVNIPDTWLDQTDLAFIDPVGATAARAAQEPAKYWACKATRVGWESSSGSTSRATSGGRRRCSSSVRATARRGRRGSRAT
jgi:carboxypeptidase C (cathepsin A)